MADIFLSYTRKDWQRVRPLAERLSAQGWSVWWDTRMRAGRRFDERIEQEIEAALCVIVVWTEASVKSHWVRAEAAEALEQDKLIPVFLDAVKLPLLFRHVQALQLQGWKGTPDERVFARLIEDVSQLAGQPTAAPAEDPAPAPRPTKSRAPRPARPVETASVSTSPPNRDKDLPEPEMVRIEPGRFLMGSEAGEGGGSDEQPRHEVRIARPFAIGRYAVTFDEYDAFARAAGQQLPGDEGWGRGRRPVINVSWQDAVAYAQWLSEQTGRHYRLPAEAEWEYAARAGTDSAWSFGGDEGLLGKYAWNLGNSDSRTHPVGEKDANAWGLHDVHGNVYEWVQDCWHENYERAPEEGSVWESGDCARRVLRGGSSHNGPWYLRSAFRFGGVPVWRYDFVGFRVAQDLP